MTVQLDFGPVTAKKAVLNRLAIALRESAEFNRQIGFETTARASEREADAIHNALADSGYYGKKKKEED